MDSTKKTKEHVDKLKVGATRGVMLLLRTKHPENKFNNSEHTMKQAWNLYNARKRLSKKILHVALTVGVVGAIGYSAFLGASLISQSNKLNDLASRINNLNQGVVSVTVPSRPKKVEGEVYLNFNPNSVKSVNLSIEHGSLREKDVTRKVGLASAQFNVIAEAVTMNGRKEDLWVQDVEGIERNKSGKVETYFQSEIFAMDSKGNIIGFGNVKIKGKGELYCTTIKYSCPGAKKTYIFATNPKTEANQTRITINQTLIMGIIKKDGSSCIKFSSRENKKLVSKTNTFDTVCIGGKGEYKSVYFIINRKNPEQLLIGGGSWSAKAVFSQGASAALEILTFNNSGYKINTKYTPNVPNESGESSNLRVVKMPDYVKLVPEGS